MLSYSAVLLYLGNEFVMLTSLWCAADITFSADVVLIKISPSAEETMQQS